MMRAWILPMLLVVCGSVVAAALILRGSLGAGAALLPAFLLFAGWNSPLMFPRSVGALEAQRRSAADGRRSSSGGRAAPTASGSVSGWGATPAGCTGSTSGVIRPERPW